MYIKDWFFINHMDGSVWFMIWKEYSHYRIPREKVLVWSLSSESLTISFTTTGFLVSKKWSGPPSIYSTTSFIGEKNNKCLFLELYP